MTAQQINITVNVNGISYQRDVNPRITLVDFLRHELNLTGTHVGCEHGVCGACTILMDGKSVRSCLILAVQVDGASLTTIEGIHGEEAHQLHPIQQAFIEENGMQCGFCTPGMIVTAVELLNNNPGPSDEEIMSALGGNICRCTGYQDILESVRLACVKMQAKS